MRITERFKELYIDVLIKILQIVFAALVIGPFVSEKFDLIKFLTGCIACLLCIIAASRIALAVKKEED